MKLLIAFLTLSSMLILAGCDEQNAGQPQNSSTPIEEILPSAQPEQTIQPEQKPSEQSSNVTSDKNSAAQSNEANYIGEARAKEIALTKAGVSEKDVQFLKVELDRDDGKMVYEVDFKYPKKNYEYEAEISATDGKILSWDIDIDD